MHMGAAPSAAMHAWRLLLPSEATPTFTWGGIILSI
jgi:hypothetical protein